jgi:hypothetical protein
MRSWSWNKPTDIVQPLDEGEHTDDTDDHDASELEWCFEDPELTMQLHAVKSGRGWMVMTVISTVVAVCAGIALVL